MDKEKKKRKKKSPEDTWQRIEYWIKRNPDKTIDECQKMLDEKLRSHKSKKPSTLEYWTNKYPDLSEEECRVKLDEYNAEQCPQRIEYWISRNPDLSETKCEELRRQYIDSYLSKRPDNSGENNPGHKSKVPPEERKRRSPMCREFWVSKFPDASDEEIDRLLENEKKKIAKTHTPENTSTRIEYWIGKGYGEKEAEIKLKERQKTFTLEKCIEKYGIENGERIYNDRQERWKNSLRRNFEKYGDGRSAQSELAYEIIGILCDRLGINRPLKEKWMYDNNKERSYAYDFEYNHKIIEINGDYWHANPKIYESGFFNKTKNMYSDEIWLYDKLKIECAKRNGYEVLVVWESDWNSDRENQLKRCIDFLND